MNPLPPINTTQPKRDVVVIGASAGGIEALRALLAEIPSDFPAALLVVLHSAPDFASRLPDILMHSGKLAASHAIHGQWPEPGHIYVAPRDNHLTVRQGYLRVVRGPKDNGHRPAVDPLFHSAAQEFGPRVMGVILSGTMSCGTAGLMSVKARGGLTIVQDPSDAQFDGMPRNAIQHIQVDHVLRAKDIGALLARVAGQPAPAAVQIPAAAASEPKPAQLACSECSGALTESELNGFPIFRCPVGHVFSLDGLMEEQESALETALWAAVRILEENAVMSERIANLSKGTPRQSLLEKTAALRQHAEVIRRMLLFGQLGETTLPDPVDASESKPTH